MWTKGESSAAVVVVGLAALLTSCQVADDAQTESGDAALRTAFGHPDLQGVWALQTLTPMERPAEFAGRATLTEEEAARLEEDAAWARQTEDTLADALAKRELEREGLIPSSSDSTSPAASFAIGGFNKVWYERGSRVTRTR